MVFSCYKELHAIEDKYGTDMVPDDDPLMIALHKKLGVTTIERTDKKPISYNYVFHERDKKIVELINYGYGSRAINKMTGLSRNSIFKIIKHYKLTTWREFCYLCNGVYIQSLGNLQHWGIHAANVKEAKSQIKRNNIEFLSIRKVWGELESGSHYMIYHDNENVKVKE